MQSIYIYVMSKFGFGPVIISWVKALYNNPSASIKTNGKVNLSNS